MCAFRYYRMYVSHIFHLRFLIAHSSYALYLYIILYVFTYIVYYRRRIVYICNIYLVHSLSLCHLLACYRTLTPHRTLQFGVYSPEHVISVWFEAFYYYYYHYYNFRYSTSPFQFVCCSLDGVRAQDTEFSSIFLFSSSRTSASLVDIFPFVLSIIVQN